MSTIEGVTRVAGFDIGTNSLRVLIADVDNEGRVRASLRIGFAVRLGEGLSEKGVISGPARARTCKALRTSVMLAQRLHAVKMLAGATHALRVASNATEVQQELERAAGIPVTVLSPEEEAYFTYVGALSGNEARCDRGFVIDVGGGSSSLIKGAQAGIEESPDSLPGIVPLETPSPHVSRDQCSVRHLVRSLALPLGCVSLTEQFLRHDPPRDEEIEELEGYISSIITDKSVQADAPADGPESFSGSVPIPLPARLPARVPLPGPGDCIIGVGGTMTALAAVSLSLTSYNARRVEGYILSLEEIEERVGELSGLSLREREALGALGRRRAEIVVAGAIIVSILVQHLGIRRLSVSTRGLRYGLALEALELHQSEGSQHA